jgi:hypothetical protein
LRSLFQHQDKKEENLKAAIVRELLKLEPSQRGSAESILSEDLCTDGTKGLQKISQLNERVDSKFTRK